MTTDTYDHDPDARLDYSWDWTHWLAASELISAQTVTSLVSGITATAVTQANGVVTAWITATESGDVTCHITTSAGRQDDRSISLRVRSR